MSLDSLDLLAFACVAVSNSHEGGVVPKKDRPIELTKYFAIKTRAACHRCGNMRKEVRYCPSVACPHIFCLNCHSKIIEEFSTISKLLDKGCAVCLGLCCCSSKTPSCLRKNHCYRKCPVSKTQTKTDSSIPTISKRKLPGENENPISEIQKKIRPLNTSSSSCIQWLDNTQKKLPNKLQHLNNDPDMHTISTNTIFNNILYDSALLQSLHSASTSDDLDTSLTDISNNTSNIRLYGIQQKGMIH